jgi:hypothetical protein
MGYKIMDRMREEYGPRRGLEGPFSFVDRVLYYDPQAGQYWDPKTDFYVEQDEMDQIHKRMVDILSR